MANKYHRIFLVLLCVLLYIPTNNGRAASLHEAPKKQASTYYAEILGHYQWGVARRNERMQSEMATFGCRLRTHLFLQLEAGHAHLNIKDKDSRFQADGVAVNLLLRWHIATTRCGTLFAEAGMGVLACNRRIPADGMETNTTPQAGIGVIIPICRRVDFVLGGRYVHVSHGLWNPSIDNPGFNSAGIYGGLHIPF